MKSSGKRLEQLITEQLGDPKAGCEVGLMFGQTSRILLEKFQDLSLIMVDRYETYKKIRESIYESMTRAMEATLFAKDRRIILIADSTRASALVEDESLDFVFIDADHSYEAVTKDMVWCNKVRPGGLFCGHDYSSSRFGVKRAVDEFATTNGYSVSVTDNWNQIWWFQKR